MMKKILFVAMAAILFSGCAMFQIDTGEKQYLAARTELNMFLEEYIKIQDQIKAEDQVTVRASFIAADASLDIWESMLGDKDYDYGPQLQIWLDAKKKILGVIGGLI